MLRHFITSNADTSNMMTRAVVVNGKYIDMVMTIPNPEMAWRQMQNGRTE